jgi:hypothetical protein
MIDLNANTMPHQLKGIKNGRDDVQRLLPNTWRNLQKQNDEINGNVYKLE